MLVEDLRQSLANGFERWAPNEGATFSLVPGLTFHRHTSPTVPYSGVMDASLSLVIAGEKRVVLGNHVFDYDNTHFLLTSIDLPVTAWVTRANQADPYIGLLLRINLSLVQPMLAIVDPHKKDVALPLGVAKATVTSELLDPILRLCRLHERPAEADLFADQVQREVIYRLLTGPLGPSLRKLAAAEGVSSGIVRALNWLQMHFRERVSIDALASIAGMGVSTLHRHFKDATAMSPLQYRKLLQLNEARRLMILCGRDAASAAYEVGYESASQFSREYHRTYGQPPISNISSARRLIKNGKDVRR